MLKELSNGLRVITVPREGTSAAAILVLVRTGSKNEEKKLSGISHFLEHMLFKGTEKMSTPLCVAEELDRIGGIYNAFTSEDYTGYYAKVKASKIALAVKWVADIYLNSLLPEKEIEKEKGVIKEEINMRFDNPMLHCDTLFQELLYGDQPAGWDVAGTKKSVSNITREDLVHYMNSGYTAKNTVVVIAGNIDSDKALNMVKRSFSSIREGDVRECLPVVERQSSPAHSFFKKKTDQTHLCFGVRCHNLLSEKKYAQEIIATVLGGMMSSRLFGKVREEMGAAYYISTSLDDNPHTGCMVTRAGVDSSRVKEVISAISKEYKRMKKEKVGAEELKKAKDYIKGKSALILEPSDSIAYFYGMQELLQKKTITPEKVFREIDRVSSEDVLSVSKEIFRSKNSNIALVGPSSVSDIEKLISL